MYTPIFAGLAGAAIAFSHKAFINLMLEREDSIVESMKSTAKAFAQMAQQVINNRNPLSAVKEVVGMEGAKEVNVVNNLIAQAKKFGFIPEGFEVSQEDAALLAENIQSFGVPIEVIDAISKNPNQDPTKVVAKHYLINALNIPSRSMTKLILGSKPKDGFVEKMPTEGKLGLLAFPAALLAIYSTKHSLISTTCFALGYVCTLHQDKLTKENFEIIKTILQHPIVSAQALWSGAGRAA